MHRRMYRHLGIPLFFIMSMTSAPLVADDSAIGYDRDIFDSRFLLEVEGGPVWQTRNDVQIPNSDQGTRFSLKDLVGTGPLPAFRAYFTWNIVPRHSLRVLVAPFRYTKSGSPNQNVLFAGETFLPGDSVDATYKFNSYRLTYRYAFLLRERWRLWAGFSAKIRDAEVGLAQGAVASEKTDVGFVPLLNLGASFRASEHWRLILDFDGLAGGPGRAFDTAFKVGYDFNPRIGLTVGYRLLEGGADVEEVYNFSLFNYLVASVVVGF